MILLSEEDIELIAAFASDVADLVECNCGYNVGEKPHCGGDCTHADAVKILKLIEVKDEDQDSEAAEAYRETARIKRSCDGDIEVDPGAIVSFSADGGAYVEAWIWISAAEADVCRECGAVNASGAEWDDALCGECAEKESLVPEGSD